MEMLTDLDCGGHGKWVLPQNGATNINHNEILTLVMLGHHANFNSQSHGKNNSREVTHGD